MVQNHLIICHLLLFTFFVVQISISATHNCTQSCPGSTLGHVQYPFGFSQSCGIRLNCTQGKIRIGEFEVRNVTSDAIEVMVPGKCNRPITDIVPLFGTNYVPSWNNGLLLKNCTVPLKGCQVPKALLESQFELNKCNETPHCFSKEDKQLGEIGKFMSLANINQSNCKVLYSSIAVDADVNVVNMSSSIALQFQIVLAEWWLDGNCSCSSYANCTSFNSSSIGRTGFRCRCLPGYEGDGFHNGIGCRKAATHKCNANKYLSGRCEGMTKFALLIGGIVTGALLVTGLAFLCYFIRRRSISLKSRNITKRLLSETAGDCSVPFYTFKEIERATNSFSEKHRLGTGAYGTVYAGRLHNDEWVAIKKIRYRDREGVEQIMNEIKLLSSVSHPNLVRLLGFCIESGEQILVYEFMPNGTLSQHLQREKGTGLPWTVRLNIAIETSQAIAHLHSAMDKPIYHRDIKSSNILLDSNFNSKVADFGLSRLGMSSESSHISTAPQGTPGYVDPQYHQNFHLSDKSDVYSFGVVLVEIITSMKVLDFSRSQNEVNLASLAIDKIGKGCVDEIIDPLLEPHRDAWTLTSVNKVAELAFRCLAFHRDMRPSMKEVAAELEQIKLSGCPMDDKNNISSSVSSFRSSSFYSSEKLDGVTATVKKVGLIVPVREDFESITKEKDSSPVSVTDAWFSGQSSPSSNSLLNNVIL